MPKIDVIILSFAKNQDLKRITQNTIASLLQSEDVEDFIFNIIVIESNRKMIPYQYENSKTIYPTVKFGFHRFLNIGLKESHNSLICFCNNDLIFHKGWATEILNISLKYPEIGSFNTFCPTFHHDKEELIPFDVNYGYQNGLAFTGWCFLVKRKIFETIGLFDEKLKFWYCDDDFRLTLQKYKIKNVLVRKSVVQHLVSKTLSSNNLGEQKYLELKGFAYFKYKWLHHNYFIYLIDRLKYNVKIFIAKSSIGKNKIV